MPVNSWHTAIFILFFLWVHPRFVRHHHPSKMSLTKNLPCCNKEVTKKSTPLENIFLSIVNIKYISSTLFWSSLYSQAVESLALLACENVDNIDSEPVPSADGDIPDLLTPISHSGVSHILDFCADYNYSLYSYDASIIKLYIFVIYGTKYYEFKTFEFKGILVIL